MILVTKTSDQTRHVCIFIKHFISVENGRADAGRNGRPVMREGANGDGEIFIFPLQLTTSKIGNHTWLMHTVITFINSSTIC